MARRRNIYTAFTCLLVAFTCTFSCGAADDAGGYGDGDLGGTPPGDGDGDGDDATIPCGSDADCTGDFLCVLANDRSSSGMANAGGEGGAPHEPLGFCECEASFCPEGRMCPGRHSTRYECVPGCEQANENCGVGFYCDYAEQECVLGCRSGNQNCGPERYCDAVAETCVRYDGRCRHDDECPETPEKSEKFGSNKCSDGRCRFVRTESGKPSVTPQARQDADVVNLKPGTIVGELSEFVLQVASSADLIAVALYEECPSSVPELQDKALWVNYVDPNESDAIRFDGGSYRDGNKWVPGPLSVESGTALCAVVVAYRSGELVSASPGIGFFSGETNHRRNDPCELLDSPCATEGEEPLWCVKVSESRNRCRLVCLADDDCRTDLPSCSEPRADGVRVCERTSD